MKPNHDVSEILDILTCPSCKKSSLHFSKEGEISCGDCNTSYPVEDGIPVLLKDKEDKDIAYLIEVNRRDMVGFHGESHYTQAGHDKHLIEGIGAKPGELILDLGCGHGHVSKWVAAASSARVVSYDILIDVLREAKADNPYVICGSADNIVFADNAFDGVIFTDVMEHILPSMQDRVIFEIYRVLKPGGRLYLDYPGNKLPYYTGYLAVNVFVALLRILGMKHKFYTLSDPTEAHVNLSFPHLVNRSFAKQGFVGKAKPMTTKFFSLPRKLRRIATLTNIFPLNYFFAVQVIGTFRKPL